MRRAAQRRRVQRWHRYVNRYIKPPFGLLGCVEPPGLFRAEMRLWGMRFADADSAAQYRRSLRTTARPRRQFAVGGLIESPQDALLSPDECVVAAADVRARRWRCSRPSHAGAECQGVSSRG